MATKKGGLENLIGRLTYEKPALYKTAKGLKKSYDEVAKTLNSKAKDTK